MSVGSTDLAAMLATLDAAARPDDYVYVVVDPAHPIVELAAATVHEEEGLTVVARRVDADRLGLSYDFVATWLTLTVHSSLEAVGLTAAFSAALGDAGISCNVIAGFHHDHLLVPASERDRALAAIHALRTKG
ncbi:MAG: ACT domain-containing protein [Salinibacterium sp.]|nr:ACT domain-containing protein [Salinibacterium sp.]